MRLRKVISRMVSGAKRSGMLKKLVWRVCENVGMRVALAALLMIASSVWAAEPLDGTWLLERQEMAGARRDLRRRGGWSEQMIESVGRRLAICEVVQGGSLRLVVGGAKGLAGSRQQRLDRLGRFAARRGNLHDAESIEVLGP